ncbi:hypothetical protein Ancab_018907, partial [Ancistrocladus abbreviatus]
MQRVGSEGPVDHTGKNVVGSWTSVIPCTGEGSPCCSRFASPEKENGQGQAQVQPLPRSNDYGLRNFDVVPPCSRKVLDVSHAEAYNNADDRDALHVPSSGKHLKSAFKEDIRAIAEKSEKGASSENTAGMQSLSQALQGGGTRALGEEGGPNSLSIGGDLERRESSGLKEKSEASITKSGPALKTSIGRPNIEGLNKTIKPKNKKKEKTKMTSPAEKGL